MTFYILQKDLFPFECLQYIRQTAVSLHRRRNLTSVGNHGNVCEAAPISLSLGTQRTQRITGNAFWNFFSS